MKIIKMELNNFRQFKGKNELIFSNDDENKITFIMAPNGTGKTTLIEAFRFLFFGNTRFKQSNTIINEDLIRDLNVGDNYEISITVEIEYNKNKYTIQRKQKVSKNEKRITLIPSGIHITYIDKNGITKSLSELNAINRIREIMPEELFDYFFFRGEEIDILGMSLFENNMEQNAFANAIKGLLGFTYLFNMKDDLERVKKTFDKDLKEALQKDESNRNLQNEIISLKNVLENRKKANDETNTEISRLKKCLQDINLKLLDNKRTTELQDERRKLKKDLEKKQESLIQIKQNMFKTFSESGWYLFAFKLIDKALLTIENEVLNDDGIPGINRDCIDYICEHRKCICGNNVGEKELKKLLELKKLIPPESVGLQISKFKDKVYDIKARYNLVYSNIKQDKENYNNYQNEYSSIEKRIGDLDKMLENVEDMSKYAEQQREIEKDIETKLRESGELEQSIKNLEEEIENKEKVRNIEHDNVEAKAIERCILYTNKVAEKLTDYLNEKQKKVKSSLENMINDIHKSVFDSNIHLKLRDDYSLLITDENNNDFETPIGFGGAELTIIAYSFILAVIRISALELKSKKNEDVEDTEPYPLVLDAPSSKMDKEVIKKFFEKMPNFAEQIIILTKDVDGEYAEKMLKEKIGRKYKFEQKSKYETQIIGE